MNKTSKALMLAAMLLVIPGCADKPESELKYEFVCYADGVLTERHVGVETIWVSRDSISTRILYTDGVVARYTPMRGETCQLELVS